MAWVQRGARRYYYRSVRRGQNTARQYLGSGEAAERAAADVERRRTARAAEHQILDEQRQRYDAALAPLLLLCSVTDHCFGPRLLRQGITNTLAAHGGDVVMMAQATAKLDPAPPAATAAPPRPEYPVELRELIERGCRGDRDVLPVLQDVFDQDPAFAALFGNLVKHAEQEILGVTVGRDLVAREAVTREATKLRSRLAATAVSELEQLLVDRIVVCWLDVYGSDVEAAQLRKSGVSPKVKEVADKRVDHAQARYLASVKALATAQKLLRPGRSVLEMLQGDGRDTSPMRSTDAAKAAGFPDRLAARNVAHGVLVTN